MFTYKDYVLNTVESICPFKKKSIYSHSYYYDMFVHVLKNVNSWRSLSLLADLKGKPKYHYTSIRKMFNVWSKHDIFNIAYKNMLLDLNLNMPNSPVNSGNDIDLFIDATFINNKNGSELVSINPLYYKKNVTKISIISDVDKIPLSIVPVKTTSYDGKTIDQTIKHIQFNRRVNLIGDKGYVINKVHKKLLYKNKIKLIVPKKKNQKNVRLSKYDKSKLKIRYKVENSIQSLKRFNRISTRKDRLIRNFISFMYLASGISFTNKIN